MPRKFAEMLMRSEITGSMYLTMSMLYTWANWKTGIVDRVSAQSLETSTNHVLSSGAYQDALKRWDDTGYITRYIIRGSRMMYRVKIHNFRARLKMKDKESGEIVTRTCTINKLEPITYDEFKKGVRVERQAEDEPISTCGTPDDAPDDEGAEHLMKTPMTNNSNKKTSDRFENRAPDDARNDTKDETPDEGSTEDLTEHAIAEQDEPAGEFAVEVQESLHKQQKQLAAAVAPSSSEEQRPKTTEIESKFLAQRFWEYLGSPAESNPSKWTVPFSELLSAYPDLGEILEFAFEKDSTKTWRNRLLGANTPLAYLRKVLPLIQESYDKWLPLEAERTEKAAVLCIQDAAKKLLASGKVFVRDGHNYKFMAVQGYTGCGKTLVFCFPVLWRADRWPFWADPQGSARFVWVSGAHFHGLQRHLRPS